MALVVVFQLRDRAVPNRTGRRKSGYKNDIGTVSRDGYAERGWRRGADRRKGYEKERKGGEEAHVFRLTVKARVVLGIG